jgi:hypothetical protein
METPMKKILAIAALVAMSFTASAAYGQFKIYAYLDAGGSVVGHLYDPCFNRPNNTTGTVTSTKILIETSGCY